jgi:GNAT superfamily N-acetyltransferase
MKSLVPRLTTKDALERFKEQYGVNYKGFVVLSYGQSQIYLYHNKKKDLIEVEGFSTWPESQGKGHGRRALQQLCRWADKYRIKLQLRVEAYKNKALTDAQLMKLYRSVGFKGHIDCMIRVPG